MSIKSKVIKNSIFSFFSQTMMICIGLFLVRFLLNNLGAKEFGLLGIINVFLITGYAALFEMGFSSSLIKYVAEYESKGEFEIVSQLFSSVFFLFLGLSLIIAMGGIFFLKDIIIGLIKVETSYKSSISKVFIFIFLSYLFQLPNLALVGYLQGRQRFDIVKITQIATYILYAVGVVVLIKWLKTTYEGVVVYQISTLFIQFIVLFFFSTSIDDRVELSFSRFSWKTLKDIWGMTGLLFISKITDIIQNSGPKFIAAFLFGPVAVAFYETSTKIPKVLKGMLGTINSAIMPAMSEMEALNNRKSISRSFLKVLRFQLMVIIPIVSLGILFADDLIAIWLGADYLNLTIYFIISMIWCGIIPLQTVGGAVLVGINRRLSKIVGYSVGIVILNLFISLTTYKYIGVMSLFLALLLPLVIIVPFYLGEVLNELDISGKLFWNSISRIIFIDVVIVCFLKLIISFKIYSHSFNLLIGLFTVITIWLLFYKYVMDESERDVATKILIPFKTF